MFLRRSSLCLLCLCIAATGYAQHWNLKKDSLYSSILNEQREVQIILPKDFNPEKSYDVLYVLDGEWNTGTFVNIQRYLHAIGFAPSGIVIGVPNHYANNWNMRDRDFTPIAISSTPFSGGAQKFLGFLKNELLPYIESKYRTSGEAALFGSSLGGLFTMYTLLTDPSVFDVYLLSDPAFHWGNRIMLDMTSKKLNNLSLRGKMLFIGGRDGAAAQYMGIAAMDSLLRISATSELIWKIKTYDDETHNSVTFKSNYDGLKYAYSGYTTETPAFSFHSGLILPDKPVQVSLNTDHLDIRYTRDKTLAPASWQSLKSSLIISDPENIIVKSFSPTGRFDQMIPLHLVTGKILPAHKDGNSRKAQGLQYAYYVDSGDSILDVSKSKPHKTGTIDSPLDFPPTDLHSYRCRIYGDISIPEDGYYVFQLDYGIGSEVYIGNKLWLKQPPGSSRRSCILPLAKGMHSIRIDLLKKANDPASHVNVFRSRNGQDEWWKNALYKF